MKQIIDIEGVGEVYAQKLQDAGIKSVEQLLQEGATPRGATSSPRKRAFPEH